MGDFLGRYYSSRDRLFLNSVQAELYADIVQVVVTLYKIAPLETVTNIYGETDQASGKFYFPGIDITCLRDGGDITTEDAEFGPDRKQNPVFMFREKMLQQINFFPQAGDLIFFNERYHEIDNVVQEQFLGGQSDKSLSIICNTHYSRLSKINLVDRQT